MTISQLLIGLLFFFTIVTMLIAKKIISARVFAYGLVLVLAIGSGFLGQLDDEANGIVYSHWTESPVVRLPMIAFGVGCLLWLLFKFVRPTIYIKEN